MSLREHFSRLYSGDTENLAKLRIGSWQIQSPSVAQHIRARSERGTFALKSGIGEFALKKLILFAFIAVVATIPVCAQDSCNDTVGAGNARGCGIGGSVSATVHLFAKLKQNHDQREAERQAQARRVYATGNWPLGATAVCRDGWISFSKHPDGACSHHGGTEKSRYQAITVQPAPAPAYQPPGASQATATNGQTYQTDYMAQGYTPHSTVQRDSHGRIKRSEAAKDAFKHEHPCPSTGRNSGACPDYVIDHVKPLECGGADVPYNMQWQTVADGKAKDKTERYCR